MVAMCRAIITIMPATIPTTIPITLTRIRFTMNLASYLKIQDFDVHIIDAKFILPIASIFIRLAVSSNTRPMFVLSTRLRKAQALEKPATGIVGFPQQSDQTP